MFLKLQLNNKNNNKIHKLLEHLEIQETEHYVMVQEVMDLQNKPVNKHVRNTVYSHYKMVMDKLVNVSVIMIYLVLLDMGLLTVE